LQEELQDSIRKSVASDFENQLKMAEQSALDNAEKLKEARKKELEYLQKEQDLQTKEAELHLQVQRQLMEGRAKLKEQLVKEEAERISLKDQEHLLRVRELEKQLEDQKNWRRKCAVNPNREVCNCRGSAGIVVGRIIDHQFSV